VARVLVRQGTLKQGDFVVAGVGAGRVRSLRDDRGRTVDKAGPGTPVELLGLDEVPGAGDPFFVVSQLQRAKDIAEELREQHRAETLTRFSKAKSLEDIFAQRQQGELAELNMILRADVSGSIDAILKSLQEIPDDEVKLNILHTGIGSVTEGDVVLAEASDAVIVGFNVTAETGAQRQAEAYGVDIRTYQVIYNVIDDIRKALEGLLEPDRAEETRGKAEVREVFQVSKAGSVAGCFVTEGTITRSHFLRVIRDGQIIVPTADDAKRRRHRAVASLRRFKDDAKEVRSGMECGIRVENFDDVKPGDILEAYEVIETARKLG
jgi:translation initiation factor IF-2